MKFMKLWWKCTNEKNPFLLPEWNYLAGSPTMQILKQNSIATDLCRWPEYCNDFSSYDLKTVTYPLIIQEWLGVRFSVKKGVM